jgi:hypothetical protein
VERATEAATRPRRESNRRTQKNTTKKTQVDLLTKARFQQNRGLGGLVISPTRELSLQIYNVLRELVGGSGASHTSRAASSKGGLRGDGVDRGDGVRGAYASRRRREGQRRAQARLGNWRREQKRRGGTTREGRLLTGSHAR